MRSYFDLGRVDTYYTRPMSEAWSKPRDVGALADEQADLELAIPLAEFPGCGRDWAHLKARSTGTCVFGRDGEFAVAALEISGSVPLVCQRCLQLMPWKIDGRAWWR
jgi:hypothetical protein